MDFPPLLLKPWPQRALSFLLGALGALAFAPLFLFPALLFSFSGIWFLLDRDIEENASFFTLFWLGWWFGLGHFIVGLYWISFALTVDLATFWWLIPFSLLGLPCILSIFIGLSFSLLKVWPYRGISRVFCFASLWISFEWIRGHIFTGFPWNLLGYVWGFSQEMIQLASLGGAYGLSLLALLLSLSLKYLVGKRSYERNIVLSLIFLAALGWMWGKERLTHGDIYPASSFIVRLVQPNIPQSLKWDPLEKEAHFKELLKMTFTPAPHPLKAIIWPETAVPFFLEQTPNRRQAMAESIPQDALLFTGALRQKSLEEGLQEIWNSLLVLNDQGEIVAHYDKSHLVPFGEYFPFRKTLDWLFGKDALKKVTAGSLDFTPGSGPKAIPLPKGFPSFTGLVCYEVIFPRAVINSRQERPEWMVNVTNDGWYGKTSGPYQHLEMARFRALEEGLPLVRVANSGVSAMFDAYGRNLGSLGLEEKGFLDVSLPSPTPFVPLYARWGDWVTLGLVLGTLALAWAFSIRVRRDEKLYLYK